MHPQLLPGAGTAILALCQVHTAQQNTSLNQGQRLPDLETIIIGGRQAECVYPSSQYAATTTKPGDPCGCTQGSQPQKGFSGVSPEPTFGDFCLATKVTRARGRETPPQNLPILRGPRGFNLRGRSESAPAPRSCWRKTLARRTPGEAPGTGSAKSHPPAGGTAPPRQRQIKAPARPGPKIERNPRHE